MKQRCPECKKVVDYTLIPVSQHPDAEHVCYDCMPKDMQKRYDEFFGKPVEAYNHNSPSQHQQFVIDAELAARIEDKDGQPTACNPNLFRPKAPDEKA